MATQPRWSTAVPPALYALYLDDEILLCDEEARVQLLDAVVHNSQRLVEREALDVLSIHDRQRKRRAITVSTVWYLVKERYDTKQNRR